MNARLPIPALLLAAVLAWPSCSRAQEASELGRSLTAMGAVRAGNADGTIPAWTGGLTRTPAGVTGFRPGVVYPDPYADEQPSFTITAANAAEYRTHLTPGELALLKAYPDDRIVVYPTHRTAALPQGFDRASITNAVTGRAKLAPDGEGVLGTTDGVPFPVPQNGLQAIWNELTRYHGDSYETQSQLAAVTPDGDYTPVTLRFRLKFIYGAQTLAPAQRTRNLLVYFMEQTLAPPRLAGNLLLVRETLDRGIEPRTAWIYNRGTRRVRLAPAVAYDNPGLNSDGLRTDDDFDLFNGATDRYDWTLLGKREIYVPYNDYRLASHALKLDQILKPHHVNPLLTRYELHRVWVVEARLKPGYSHIYSRRVFYLDEDSWAPLLDDEYDDYGLLWRVGENHLMQLWDVPVPFSVLQVLTDLESGRYIASNLVNNSDLLHVARPYTAADFTPAALRRAGVR